MRVLVGIDGSSGSNLAASLIGLLLSPARDQILLYYSPPQVDVGGFVHRDPALLQEARQDLAERVFARARGFLPEPLAQRAETMVGEQKPSHGILAAAEKHRADMIVVGARGAGPISRLLLGSVSRSVVHRSRIPVLVARATDRGADPLRTLIACDRRGISEEAVQLAGRLTWPEQSEGVVVHVIESIFAGQIPDWLREEALATEEEPLSRIWVEEEEQNRQEVEEELAAVCTRLPDPFRKRAPVVLNGHPGDELLNYIQREQIGLVVLGSRSHGALTRLFAGSTSEQLLVHSGCSVLIVPHHEAP